MDFSRAMQIAVSQPRSRDLRTWRVPIGWNPSQLPRARLKAASDTHNVRHLILFSQHGIPSLGVTAGEIASNVSGRALCAFSIHL